MNSSKTTRRGVIGKLVTLSSMSFFVNSLFASSEDIPIILKEDPSFSRHCRICDRVFDKGENKHLFMDFFFIKEPIPVENNYMLTAQSDVACNRCFSRFCYNDKDIEKSWTPTEKVIFEDYKRRMLQRPR